MADHSKAQDHRRMAQLLLTQARNSQGPEEFDGIIRTAQVHATLAVADAITAQTAAAAAAKLVEIRTGGAA